MALVESVPVGEIERANVSGVNTWGDSKKSIEASFDMLASKRSVPKH